LSTLGRMFEEEGGGVKRKRIVSIMKRQAMRNCHGRDDKYKLIADVVHVKETGDTTFAIAGGYQPGAKKQHITDSLCTKSYASLITTRRGRPENDFIITSLENKFEKA
ncbi:hypothetical protein ACJX0J_016352, partial [Zea mays]